jgi:hypothetical protein
MITREMVAGLPNGDPVMIIAMTATSKYHDCSPAIVVRHALLLRLVLAKRWEVDEAAVGPGGSLVVVSSPAS